MGNYKDPEIDFIMADIADAPVIVYLDACNPEVEECNTILLEENYGSSSAALALGVVAALKTLTPLILRYTAASSSVTSSSAQTTAYAWAGWVYGNLLIYGILMILWPLTYFQIEVLYSFYLTWYDVAGINIGAILLFTAIVALFLASAINDSAQWAYFAVYAVLEPALWYLAKANYEDAYYWYNPSVVYGYERVEKVEDTDDDTDDTGIIDLGPFDIVEDDDDTTTIDADDGLEDW